MQSKDIYIIISISIPVKINKQFYFYFSLLEKREVIWIKLSMLAHKLHIINITFLKITQSYLIKHFILFA